MDHSSLFYCFQSGNMTARAVSYVSLNSTLCIHALTSRSSPGLWKLRFCTKLKSPLVKQSKTATPFWVSLIQLNMESTNWNSGHPLTWINKPAFILNTFLFLLMLVQFWHNLILHLRLCLSPAAPQSLLAKRSQILCVSRKLFGAYSWNEYISQGCVSKENAFNGYFRSNSI